MPPQVDPQWYKKIWSLDIQDMSWVEHTAREVDFVECVLALPGQGQILDLACGFGRHALELARRGYAVVGVDITEAYITQAQQRARAHGLDNRTEFICADVRDVSFHNAFDVVLNLADGAIGYLENDTENSKMFDLVASALKHGGKHLMGVCNGAYAIKHFPRRHWEAGNQSLSLADFTWDAQTSRMLYTGYAYKYGEPLTKPDETCSPTSTRLYTLEELREIFQVRGMEIRQAYGDYDPDTPASDDLLTLLVYSQKIRT
ncbi:MAG: class I SAM-dependent methyltransferase [Anaerolineae bacterium]|nr:class I SAM-dependent methyltransferase [Anaerolineae bacterium]